MNFRRYINIDEFCADVLDVLMVNEVKNNLLISILTDSKRDTVDKWLMGAVFDDNNDIILVAICTPPFNLLLCEPVVSDETGTGIEAVDLMVRKLKSVGFSVPGIIAEKDLARRFADAYCKHFGNVKSDWKMTMIVMKLDKLAEYEKAPGLCRMLADDDLEFAPSWEYAFCIDCKLPVYSSEESRERLAARIGKNIHYIWENNVPVAQAVFGRNTPNGAAISWVYTPPEHRGHGYAKSVVAELCKSILLTKSFCCLFADAANPASCAVYRRLGFYDVCEVDEIKFN